MTGRVSRWGMLVAVAGLGLGAPARAEDLACAMATDCCKAALKTAKNREEVSDLCDQLKQFRNTKEGADVCGALYSQMKPLLTEQGSRVPGECTLPAPKPRHVED